MKKVDCDLAITAFIECPNAECENLFDLFEIEDLTDDGYLYQQLLEDGRFGKRNFGEIVQCPECKQKFIVGDVIW